MFSFFKKTFSQNQPKFNLESSILVTGGTGFAGSHLVERLVTLGFTNIHVTSFGSKNSHVHSLLSENNIHKVNLTDKNDVFDLINKIKPEQIYHLAAISEVGKSFDEASKIINNNISLQLNILEAIKEIVPKSRLLIVGSALEYDLTNPKLKLKNKKISEDFKLGPANPYGVSKVAQDLLGLSYHYSYNLDIVRVRPFNHIGERQAPGFVVSDFAKQIVGSKVENPLTHSTSSAQASLRVDSACRIKVGNLKAIRDFTDVKDVVKAYILVMQNGKAGEVYNIGSGVGYSMKEILNMLIKLSGSNVKVIVDKEKFRPLDVPKIIADNRKIASLGWETSIPIEETLIRVLDYWRNL